MLDNILPIHGAFTICMEMLLNGPEIGTVLTVPGR